MSNVRTTLLLFVLARPLLAQGAPPQVTADEPYTMEYSCKVQWGHQQKFLRLFLKNHYPLLRKGVESGRMISVKIETPANHMTEDARWDYRVTIKFKNSTVATTANPQEESWISQLWPDQETYKREEQRRFEILFAHWDLPVTDVTPSKKSGVTVKIVVLGAGAVGSYYGGQLARVGHDVTCFARGETLAALRARGLEVRTPEGAFHAHVTATDDREALGPADWTILAVKSYWLEGAIGRVGQTEFAVVAPGTDAVGAVKLAERFRHAMPTPELRAG